MTRNIGGLQKYTKESKIKFESSKLLLEYPNSYYPDKFIIQYHEFEEPKDFDLWDAIKGDRIKHAERNIVFGTDAPEKELIQYDFLWCPDGPAFVVHKRVLDKFNEFCPNDIQALPMVIKNLNPKGAQFENKDFWLINTLATVEAFDKNYVYYSDLGVPNFHKKVILNGSMKEHLIARDKTFQSYLIFYPSLAKHFIKSRGIQFLTDEEAP